MHGGPNLTCVVQLLLRLALAKGDHHWQLSLLNRIRRIVRLRDRRMHSRELVRLDQARASLEVEVRVH
jgi:hypothetical protein